MNVYVVFSEHPISVHIRNLNAVRHDSILVFALDGDAPIASWSPLEAIDTDDSETFCRQCGMTVGWLLESGHSEMGIRTIWKELITDEVYQAIRNNPGLPNLVVSLSNQRMNSCKN
jgi:hypothetical protein